MLLKGDRYTYSKSGPDAMSRSAAKTDPDSAADRVSQTKDPQENSHYSGSGSNTLLDRTPNYFASFFQMTKNRSV